MNSHVAPPVLAVHSSSSLKFTSSSKGTDSAEGENFLVYRCKYYGYKHYKKTFTISKIYMLMLYLLQMDCAVRAASAVCIYRPQNRVVFTLCVPDTTVFCISTIAMAAETG